MQLVTKRVFDVLFSVFVLLLFFWLLILAWLLAAISTRTSGFFVQERVGQYGRKFNIYKLRTMQINQNFGKVKIPKLGRLLRSYKLDELPQLINVIKGQMSIVGPRPDILGYYDLLVGENKKILALKPGLTSLASLKYYNEDAILEAQSNPLRYNDEVIFPDKIKMNLDYYYNQSFSNDIKIIVKTVSSIIAKT